MAAQFFVNGAVVASFVPRLPEIRDRVGITVGTLGLTLTVAGLFGLLGSVLAAPLIGRLGTRRTMTAGSVVLASTLVLIGSADSQLGLAVGLAAFSASDVVVDVAMNLQGSRISARRTTPVINRLHGLWSLGTVLGGLAAAQVSVLGVSLQAHLLTTALLLIGAIVFVGRRLPTNDEATLGSAHNRARVGGERRLVLAPLALAGGFAIVVEVTASDWAAFRLADDFGASAGQAGFGFVAFTVGMTAGRFGGDWLAVRVGRDRLFRGAVLLAAAGLAGATLVPNQWVGTVSFALAGIGAATFVPKLYDDAARVPGRPGAGLGALTAGNRLGSLAAPTIVGMLAATSLTVGSAVALVTLPSAAALLLLARTTSTPR